MVRRDWRGRCLPPVPVDFPVVEVMAGRRCSGSIREVQMTYFLSSLGFPAPSVEWGIWVVVPVHLASPGACLGMTFSLLLGVGLEKALPMCQGNVHPLREPCHAVWRICTKGPPKKWRFPEMLLMPVGELFAFIFFSTLMKKMWSYLYCFLLDRFELLNSKSGLMISLLLCVVVWWLVPLIIFIASYICCFICSEWSIKLSTIKVAGLAMVWLFENWDLRSLM